MFSEEIAKLKKLGVQGTLFQALSFLTVIASGLIMWKGLCLFTNSESPIVVVLSGSMEPAFYRGDILFLTNPEVPYEIGDITVYKIPGSHIPIVHRVIESHISLTLPTSNTTQLLLTKGDNNKFDDISLYQGMEWIERQHVIGKVRGFLPYVGYVTIAMNDFPKLKYGLLGSVAIASDQTLENQNEEELNSLHGKIKSLRHVTIDILDDANRQNDQLDRTVRRRERSRLTFPDQYILIFCLFSLFHLSPPFEIHCSKLCPPPVSDNGVYHRGDRRTLADDEDLAERALFPADAIHGGELLG
nr:signal peptidase I [Cryptococcus depauperatus CBS 7855]